MSTHNVQREVMNHGLRSRPCSHDLWADCPLLDILINPTRGFCFFDDFLTLSDEWTVTQAGSAGTMTIADALGGVVALDAADSDDGDGANMQLNTTVGEIFVPEASAQKNLWFEARIKVDIITDDMFVGLAVIDTTVLASSAITTANHLGFTSFTDDGVLLSNGEKAGAGTTGVGTTVEAGVWVRLGFKVKTDMAGAITCCFYVDGAAVNRMAAANVPLVAMVPSFVMQSGGTAAPIMSIDWIKCAQLR